MTRPVPHPQRRTPLTAAMAWERTRALRASQRLAPSTPTVEEVSAGGIVIDPHSPDVAVAIIARYNRGGRLEWCLPKGHPEGQESHEQAAVREIAEETGIQGQVVAPLGSIDYWFMVPQYRVHKTVHHFLLIATGGELTIENDPDHEAVDVAWVPLMDLPRCLTFLNERRIAEMAREVIESHEL